MNRREFVKHASALLALSTIGIPLYIGEQTSVEIVDIEFGDRFDDCITIDRIHYDSSGSGMAYITFNAELAMDMMRLVDSNGKRWSIGEIERMIEDNNT